MMITRRAFPALLLSLFVGGLLFSAGCDGGTPDNGTGENGNTAKAASNARPEKLVFGFVPSAEAATIADSAKPMADFIAKEIGIPVETFTSTDYAGMVEAMGSGKVDIASFGPFSYVLANDQGAAEVILKTSRRGSFTYPWMFVARADSGIAKIEDAKGKKIAFVDPSSTSGYLYPAYYLKKQDLDPNDFFSQVIFAGSHDTAVRNVYQGTVDVAAVYDDVRDKLVKTLPDVKDKVKVLYTTRGTSGEIPNDAIAVRPGLSEELKTQIKQALLKYAEVEEGKKTLAEVYDVDALTEAKDEDYNPVRDVAKMMDVNLRMFEKTASPAPSPSPGT
ncbi:MAG: phosphate/phosphite/phosphonate ABC transporter substrate-binding protein [Armatimonadaceae bacterium]